MPSIVAEVEGECSPRIIARSFTEVEGRRRGNEQRCCIKIQKVGIGHCPKAISRKTGHASRY